MELLKTIEQLINISKIRDYYQGNPIQEHDISFFYNDIMEKFAKRIPIASDEEVKEANDYLDNIINGYNEEMNKILNTEKDYTTRKDIIEYLDKHVKELELKIKEIEEYKDTIKNGRNVKEK